MSRVSNKKNIFNASLVLFSEYGYDNVTTRKLTAKAGVTEGALYRHFDNKKAILDEIFNLYKRNINEYSFTKSQIDEYVKTDTPREFLKRVILRCPDNDMHFMAYASRIVYRESLTNEVAYDIMCNLIYKNRIFTIKYMLDLLVERKSIPKIDTHLFSLLWAQSTFTAYSFCISSYLKEKSKLEIAKKECIEIFDYLIDMAISGSIKVD